MWRLQGHCSEAARCAVPPTCGVQSHAFSFWKPPPPPVALTEFSGSYSLQCIVMAAPFALTNGEPQGMQPSCLVGAWVLQTLMHISWMIKWKKDLELKLYAIPSTQKLSLPFQQAQSYSTVSTRPCPLPGTPLTFPRVLPPNTSGHEGVFKQHCGGGWQQYKLPKVHWTVYLQCMDCMVSK